MTNVLVIGGSGFIGSHLTKSLCDHGLRVVNASRNALPSVVDSRLAHVNVGDFVRDPGGLAPLLGTNSVVINLAGRAHRQDDNRNDELYKEVNENFPPRLYSICAAHGVKQFIQVSSASVYGVSPGSPIGHESPACPEGIYAKTKWQADKNLVDLSRDSVTNLTIIRPPLVYGPGAPGNIAKLEKLVSSNLPLPFGSLKNKRHFVSVFNLCDFIFRCIESPRAYGKILLVADDRSLSTPELVRLIARNTGSKTRVFPAPVWMLKLVAKATGREAEIAKLAGTFEINTAHSTDLLGWSALYSVEESFRKTYVGDK